MTLAVVTAEIAGMLAGWVVFKTLSRWWPVVDAVLAMARQGLSTFQVVRRPD